MPESLVQAIRGVVFRDTEVQDDKAAKAVGTLVARARSRVPTQFTRLIDRAGKAAADRDTEDLARKVVCLALLDYVLDELAELDESSQDALLAAINNRLALHPDELAALARVAAEAALHGDSAQAAPARVELAELLKTHLVPPSQQGAPTQGDGWNMNDQPNDYLQDLDEDLKGLLGALHASFAFDEARLPKRLHYSKRPPGSPQMSDGQARFLVGTIKALMRLDADVEGEDQNRIIASTAGILLLDGHHDPDERAFFSHVSTAYMELMEAASASRPEIREGDGDFHQKRHVFEAVSDVLEEEGSGTVFYDAYAAVSRGMADTFDTRSPGSAGFAPAVLARYQAATLAAGGGDGGGSGIAFLDLPPLHDPGGENDEIKPDNIAAISAIYVVYQCEQLMLFKCVERIVELFMAGLLPMSGDNLARKLDDYYWNREDQVSEAGRYANYARALGAPGGDIGPDAPTNSEFNMHLMRCVSTIAAVQSERSYAALFAQPGGITSLTKGEYARKAMRDWAANCTLFGYAGAQFAAERLGNQLRQAMEILQLPRIKEIYGVNTMWQVIERVAQSEFGVTVNISKHVTLAEETRVIMGVLADRAAIWSQSSGRPLFSVPGVEGDLDLETSNRLFRAAQYFLAVNGVQDTSIREYSQPVETPAMPSVPSFGSFGGDGAGIGGGAGGDVAGQIKDLLGRGITPDAAQLKSILGVN